jgi:hypothetical protein
MRFSRYVLYLTSLVSSSFYFLNYAISLKKKDALCLNRTMNSCAVARQAPVISIHHVGDIFSRFIHL